MFFAFATDHQYDEVDWPWVWELEKAIQALILAARADLVELSVDQLSESIANYLKEIGFPPASVADSIKGEELGGYMRREVAHIAAFIETIAATSKDARPRDLGLMPLPRFQQSIETSKSFRAHLHGVSRAGSAEKRGHPLEVPVKHKKSQ